MGAKQFQSQGKVGSIVGAKIKVEPDTLLVPTESVLTLSKSQKTIINYVFDQCVWNNNLVTQPLTILQIINATQLNEETIKSSIKRLKNKKFIDRAFYKDGKGGWTQYRISELSYKELLSFRQMHQNSTIIAQQSQGKVGSIVGANGSRQIDRYINNNLSIYLSIQTTKLHLL